METGYLKQDQLEEAVTLQKQSKKGRLGEWLMRLGFVEERQITRALSRQFGLPLIDLHNSAADNEAVKMIPGKVAKSSGLLPVGFGKNRNTLQVAVSGPLNFNSHHAIRRMLQKGLVTYIGDQSAIRNLLECWYRPEDLDMSGLPSYRSLKDIIAIGRELIATAVNQHADNIQAELIEDFLWIRLDFPTALHHYFYRQDAQPSGLYEYLTKRDENVARAAN
jgi:hypothetical protein